MADFVGKPSGLTVDVSYFYEDRQIGYATAATWSEDKELSVSTTLADTTYVAIMHENNFAIPSQFAGYGGGFRYWAAVRDGLGAREEGVTFESLTGILKPLRRPDNLMIPHATVGCKITRPEGYDTPRADNPGRPVERRAK